MVKLGIDMRDPLEPGPDYYEGCYAEEEVEIEAVSDSSEIKDAETAEGTTTVKKELVFAVVDEEEEEAEEELVALDQSELPENQESAVFFN